MYEQSLSFLRRSVIPSILNTTNQPKEATVQCTDKSETRKKKKVPSTSRRASLAMSIDGEAEPPALVIKTGPKESHDAKKKALLSDTEHFSDGAETLRGILGADAVAVLKLEDYQIYVRRDDRLELDLPSACDAQNPQDNPLFQFAQGKPWPSNCEPVVHHVPAPGSARVVLLGTASTDPSAKFHFL